MAEITAAAVKSLRERTGAGMMDCKRALQESDGNEERAIDLLRQKGAAKAAKRSGREVSEGTVQVASANGATALVEVLSETDFVARSDAFEDFARRTAERVAELPLPDGEVVEGETFLSRDDASGVAQELDELRVKVGENVQLSRVVRVTAEADATVASYIHFGNRIGVLVELEGVPADDETLEAARGVAMHVAATNPVGVSPDDIPADEVERERAVLIEQAKGEGKPEQIVEKIVEGRMRKFFEENALLWQSFVREPDVAVKDVLARVGDDLTVTRFVRFEIGA